MTSTIESLEASPEISTPDIYRPNPKSAANKANHSTFTPEKTIHVSELDYTVSENDLYEIFSKFGSIITIKIAEDRTSGKPLGYAFVKYREKEDAHDALSFNNKPVLGKPCRVKPFYANGGRKSSASSVYSSSGGSNRTKVFVNNLDPSTTTDDLRELFSQFGTVVSCVVPIDTYRRNPKLFGYVDFESPDVTRAAIENMNGKLVNGNKIYVRYHYSKSDRAQSVEEHKANYTNLFVKNIDTKVSEKELSSLFAKYGDIQSVSLQVDEEGNSKGFAFITFATHDQAVAAVEGLNNFVLEGKALYVARTQRRFERDEEWRQNNEAGKYHGNARYGSINLYVTNLDPSVNQHVLTTAFSRFGTITSARVLTEANGESRGFGFVCFSTPEESQQAIKEMNNTILNGKSIQVSLARQSNPKKPTRLLPIHPFYVNNLIPPLMAAQISKSQDDPLQPSSPYGQHALSLSHSYDTDPHSNSASPPPPHKSPYRPGSAVPTIPIPGYPYYYQYPPNYLLNASNGAVGPHPSAPPGYRGVPLLGINGEPILLPSPSQMNFPPLISAQLSSGSSQGSRRSAHKSHTHYHNHSAPQHNHHNNHNHNSHYQHQNQTSGTIRAQVESAATPEDAKQIIGEALYERIKQHPSVHGDSEITAKLTGMILEFDIQEILKWIADDNVLDENVQEAYDQYMDFLNKNSESLNDNEILEPGLEKGSERHIEKKHDKEDN